MRFLARKEFKSEMLKKCWRVLLDNYNCYNCHLLTVKIDEDKDAVS
jgi:hypothetical protein